MVCLEARKKSPVKEALFSPLPSLSQKTIVIQISRIKNPLATKGPTSTIVDIRGGG